MILGFDAKRAYYNRSGLGNYSRDTLRLLMEYDPDNEYHLFTPEPREELFTPPAACRPVLHHPGRGVNRVFPSYWRSRGLLRELDGAGIQLFHGLSNELPFGIKNHRARSVVTIHDLIFLRFPSQYPWPDRQIYAHKTRQACREADLIVAISQQTREDLIRFMDADPERVRVIYQGCHPVFNQAVPPEARKEVLNRYQLPDQYILSVGTIEERKNLLNLIRALRISGTGAPLVVVGKPRAYARLVKDYIRQHRIEPVYFLEGVLLHDLAALYQSARMLVYPSLFEGFGIPILEALRSGIPVITSMGGCFHEVAGQAGLYADPYSPEDIAEKIVRLLEDDDLHRRLVGEAAIQEARFRDEAIAREWIQLYQSLI